jgi:hypothetical protein
MGADDFVRLLRLCTPQLAEYVSAGVSAEVAAELAAPHSITQKVEPPLYGDPVLDLVSRFDVSRLEIGMARFCDRVIAGIENWQFGWDEADPLVVHRDTGEIRLYEFHARQHMISRCGQDGARYLDAMLIAACFLADPAQMKMAPGDPRRLQKVDECAAAAGGDAYRPYYEILLGYW